MGKRKKFLSLVLTAALASSVLGTASASAVHINVNQGSSSIASIGTSLLPFTPEEYTTLLNLYTRLQSAADYLRNSAGLDAGQKQAIKDMQSAYSSTYAGQVKQLVMDEIDFTAPFTNNKDAIIDLIVEVQEDLLGLRGYEFTEQELTDKINEYYTKLNQLRGYGIEPFDFVTFADKVYSILDAQEVPNTNLLSKVNEAIDQAYAAIPAEKSLLKYGIEAEELKNSLKATLTFINTNTDENFKAARNLLEEKLIDYINLDTTAPAAPEIATVIRTRDTSPEITIKAEVNSQLVVKQIVDEAETTVVDVKVGETGEVRAKLTLSLGEHNFTATATDAAGNVSEPTNFKVIVERSSSGDSSGGGGGGGGGGAGNSNVTPEADGVTVEVGSGNIKSETTADGRTVAIVNVPEQALTQAFEKLAAGDVPKVIKINAGTADNAVVALPANALVNAGSAAADAIISIQGNGVSYDLPVSVLDFASIATSLGDLKNAVISVKMEKSSKDAEGAIAQNATQQGATLVSAPIDFSITVEANGKTISIDNFGSTYVSRTISVSRNVDSSKATGVLYNPASGTFSFVPATFASDNGKTVATLKRNGNSTYAIVEHSKTFADVQTHWAKADVNLLASKLIVNGMTDTTFAPENKITRAQFAALVVRALGLTEEAPGVQFSDVKAADWFASSVATAAKFGIVTGFEDQTFRPDANITREQMAVMVARALQVAGKSANVSAAEQQALLAKFTDNAAIGAWAQASVAQAVDAGIINGMTASTYEPTDNATRAQATVMLKRLLLFSDFLN